LVAPFRHVELSMFPRRQFVYGRHLIRGFLSATVAPGGVGKSALSIVEAVAMVSGRSLRGTRPRKPLRVWYWNGEDPAEEIQRRVEATCLAFDVDPASFEGRLFIDSGRRTEIVLASQGKSGTLLSPGLRSKETVELLQTPF
jgi:hypothetical protein